MLKIHTLLVVNANVAVISLLLIYSASQRVMGKGDASLCAKMEHARLIMSLLAWLLTYMT